MKIKERSEKIKIDKKDLEKFLFLKRGIIESPIYTGIGEVITGLSFVCTVATSNLNNVPIIGADVLKGLLFICSIITVGLGIYNLIKSYLSRQLIQNLCEGICELDINKIHIVNILLLKNISRQGKYLLVNNKQWKCELFPSYYADTTQSNKYDVLREQEKVISSFSRDIGCASETIKVTYLGVMPVHMKVCAGRNVLYRYVFHFYRVEIEPLDMKLRKRFKHNGQKYVWKSLNQMLKNRNIRKKNGDVINHVANLENIPYN